MEITNSRPIFQSIFGTEWEKLPPVIHKHYANRPYCTDVITAEGIMDVTSSRLADLLSPLFRLVGTLVPYTGENIPVTVIFRSEEHSAAFCFDRTFHFPGKAPVHFRSHMLQLKDQEVIEFMRFGLGWHMRFHYDGSKVTLNHRGYVLKLFGRIIPLPLSLIIGKGYAEEEALSEDSFRMEMTITHPLFGRIFGYKGIFKMLP